MVVLCNIRNIFHIFGAIVLFCGFPISAAIYYVDNSDMATCNNTIDAGTEDRPWCSIAYALKQIHGGDTLRIKKGIYENQYTLTIPASLSGTEANPTLIEANGDDSVIISGPGVSGGRVAITGVSWLVFRKIAITSYNQGIFVQEGSHDVLIDSCEVHNVGQEAIHVKENSHHITIQNCRIHDTRKWNYNGEGFYIGTGSAGPVDTTNNIIVRNCTIYNTTDEAIEFKPGTFNCIAENNHIYNVFLEGVWGAIEINQHTAGVQIAPHKPSHIVSNNIIYNVTCSGIRAGTGCTVYNNIVYEVGQYGIYADNISSDTWKRIIYHNTVEMVTDSAIVASKADTDIKNNIGPDSPGNLAFNIEWFVKPEGAVRDFDLVDGAAPIDSGSDLRLVVPKDIDNTPRDEKPDMGAFEYRHIVCAVEQSIENHRTLSIPKYRVEISSKTEMFLLHNKDVKNLFSLNGKCLSGKRLKGTFRLPTGFFIFRH